MRAARMIHENSGWTAMRGLVRYMLVFIKYINFIQRIKPNCQRCKPKAVIYATLGEVEEETTRQEMEINVLV